MKKMITKTRMKNQNKKQNKKNKKRSLKMSSMLEKIKQINKCKMNQRVRNLMEKYNNKSSNHLLTNHNGKAIILFKNNIIIPSTCL
jgi:hypothetical protein